MYKVSVIVPVYNVENYIEKCLESLVKQTLEDIEIIIVNDGSTDKSIDIIKKYCELYKEKIKYYAKENGGLSDARNYGMQYTKGEYIAFVDSDDYVDINMYEEMYKKAKKENADIVECDFIWEHQNKTRIDYGRYYNYKTDFFKFGRAMVCNKIFKSKIISEKNIKFSKGLNYEDIEFSNKVVPYINKIVIINTPFYHYIQRIESIINNQNEKTADIFIILKKIVDFYKKENLYDEYKVELEYMYIRFLLGSSFLRIIKIKNKTLKKELLKNTWKELNSEFPNWKKNNILKKQKTVKNFYYKTVNRNTFIIYSEIFKVLSF